MNRMFEDAFRGSQWDWPQAMGAQVLGGVDLELDISEKEDEFVVKASVPGINPDDLDISFSGQTLTIKGEVKEENEDKNEQYHVRERRYGSFSRTINLPNSIQADAIEANYDRGILTLRLPKAEEVRPKRIAVKANESKMIDAGPNGGQSKS
jgi:HSP20 family protein